MANKPDVRVRIEEYQVVDEALFIDRSLKVSIRYVQRRTHHAAGVEQTLFDQRITQTGIVAMPVLRVAVTHGTEDPSEIDAGTAAREQQIIVEFVLLRCRSSEDRAFDGEDHR